MLPPSSSLATPLKYSGFAFTGCSNSSHYITTFLMHEIDFPSSSRGKWSHEIGAESDITIVVTNRSPSLELNTSIILHIPTWRSLLPDCCSSTGICRIFAQASELRWFLIMEYGVADTIGFDHNLDLTIASFVSALLCYDYVNWLVTSVNFLTPSTP